METFKSKGFFGKYLHRNPKDYAKKLESFLNKNVLISYITEDDRDFDYLNFE